MDSSSERQMENWLWQHPEAFGQHVVLPDDFQWVARQVELPYAGSADLIGMCRAHLYVVELKARPLKLADLAQVLRYRQTVITMADSVDGLPTWLWNDDVARWYWEGQPGWLCTAYLVGTQCSPKVFNSAERIRIRVLLVDPDRQTLVRDPKEPHSFPDFDNFGPAISRNPWLREWATARLTALLGEWSEFPGLSRRQLYEAALRSDAEMQDLRRKRLADREKE